MSGEFLKSEKKWKNDVKDSSQRDYSFKSASGEDVDLLYYPKKNENSYLDKLNFPGQFPYTRGIHSNLYRGKLWTMRQFAGFGTPAETNQRFKHLLREGQTGLSVAFDMPTLMGYDADHKLSEGEVGMCGVAISSLKDMEILFDGIDLSKISVSMTINGPAVVLFAFYIAVAENQGVDISKLQGTLQNDILKEFIAQKEWIYPPDDSMRIIVDMIKYCTIKMPRYNTISVSGYHIREAGSTAIQELAFTLADGFCYIDHAIKAGLDVDDFAPRLSFFFNSHLDFFEEISKFRAARRIWSHVLKNKYNAKRDRSLKLRFHAQTAGFSLTAQQPENNISRTAFQALAAVLGGTQSLHTNSMDETLCLPSQQAAEIALRTQQLIGFETGAPNVVDPLGGSWYIEELTDKIEKGVYKYFSKIDELGGVISAIEMGYFQREIAESASDYQRRVDTKRRIVVGVNEFIKKDENIDIPIQEIREEVENEQIERLRSVRNQRNTKIVISKLQEITNACSTKDNLMPLIIDAAQAHATLGEIVDSMKNVFGEWHESVEI